MGKSTLLAAWAQRHDVAWYTLGPEDGALSTLGRGLVDALRLRVPDLPVDLAAAPGTARGPDASADEDARADAFAAALSEALQERLRRPLALVLDDLHALAPDGAAMRAVEALCRQAPEALHVVLASRAEPPFSIDRLRGQGQVLELGGADPAFAPTRSRRPRGRARRRRARARRVAPRGDCGLAGGGPAGARGAAQRPRRPSAARRSSACAGPAAPLFGYLAREVLAQESPPVRELVRLAAPLERVHPACAPPSASRAPPTRSASLARRGLFAESHPPTAGSRPPGLMRDVALASLPLADDDLRGCTPAPPAGTRRTASPRWPCARWRAIGDDAATARLLAEHGAALLREGAVEALVEAGEALPAAHRDAALDRLLGEAHQLRGDWTRRSPAWAARRAPRADRRRDWLAHRPHPPPARAPRPGAGGLSARPRRRASRRATSRSCTPGTRAPTGCAATPTPAARSPRRPEVAVATARTGAAAAHTVLAMLAALDGDRASNDAHYLRALDHAERAGDVLQVIRIRVNRGSRNLEEGAYEAAIVELDLAIRLADLGGFGAFRALALTNRGESRLRLGRLEEAIADLDAARLIYQRLGSDDVAYPLGILGDVYRERGDAALARAAYEEAARRGDAMGDLQALVPALAGLARVLATDDPEQAARSRSAPPATGPAWARPPPCSRSATSPWPPPTATGAARAAAQAGAAARGRRDRARMAEALELEGLSAATEPRAPARSSRRSRSGTSSATPLGEARAQLALALARRASAARPRRARPRRACASSARARRWPPAIPSPPAPRGDRGARALSRAARRRAGPALGLALAQGARPAEDPGGAPRAAGLARRAHRGAVARGGPRPLRQPPVGRAQHAARRARPASGASTPTTSSSRARAPCRWTSTTSPSTSRPSWGGGGGPGAA